MEDVVAADARGRTAAAAARCGVCRRHGGKKNAADARGGDAADRARRPKDDGMMREEEEEDASNSGRMARLLIYLLAFRYLLLLCSNLYRGRRSAQQLLDHKK